jgi:thermostable 8-oxoguanine DNA glycosylase
MHDDLEQHVLGVLKAHGGIRRAPTIAAQTSENFAAMEAGLWSATYTMLEHVRNSSSKEAERKAANFIQDHFKGFGPKQSRNLLQTLGLSRYEIPIDSRITKWLNDFGFPIKLTATALSDRDYYRFVSEGFQQLCAASGVLPCLLDAAIFSSYDGEAWTKDNVVG